VVLASRPLICAVTVCVPPVDDGVVEHWTLAP
jgi:hypothetical protein